MKSKKLTIKQFTATITGDLPDCKTKVDKPEIDKETNQVVVPIRLRQNNLGMKVMVSPEFGLTQDNATQVRSLIRDAFKTRGGIISES